MDNNTHIEQAVRVLNTGGIIIFPTDTAFGIGCRIDNYQAIDRLFTIRNRPTYQATPVLVSSIQMAETYFSKPSTLVKNLMHAHWPGALTIVSACDVPSIYSLVRGGGNTIGLRMPNHATTLEIIRQVGVPILGPSANFHGLQTPYTYDAIDPELAKLVQYIVPGECSVGQASTVVDCSIQPYKILRQGSIIIV